MPGRDEVAAALEPPTCETCGAPIRIAHGDGDGRPGIVHDDAGADGPARADALDRDHDAFPAGIGAPPVAWRFAGITPPDLRRAAWSAWCDGGGVVYRAESRRLALRLLAAADDAERSA